MAADRALGFNDIWIGQMIREPGNAKRYRVISIRSNPDQIVVRAVGGRNTRTILRQSLEIAWFPAGAVPAKDQQEEE
jgi:hypothetical protein